MAKKMQEKMMDILGPFGYHESKKSVVQIKKDMSTIETRYSTDTQSSGVLLITDQFNTS